MKKHLLAAAAFALAAPAFAQSSVTIYGIIDLDGQYLSGHTKDVLVTSGGLAGSRLGFKGTEDIGGGNFVDFVLEGGLNVDTGGSAQGGALFGRQAFGDIRTHSAGTFSAGRQYSSTYIISGDFSAFSNTSVGATTAVLGGYAGGYEPVRGGSATGTLPATGESNNGGPARVNNSFRYTTPDFAGFKLSGLYGAGEVTGQTKQTRLFDGSVRYTGFGLDAMVGVVSDKAQGATANLSTNVVTTMAGASYAIANAHIEGGFLKGNDRRPANIDGKGFWLGGDYRIGPNLIRAQWLQNQIDTAAVQKLNAIGVGYQYDFSKRTALYTSITRFDNNAASGLGRANAAIPAGVTTTTDNDLSEFVVGVRHNF